MDDHDDFARVMRENKRGANDFWYWKDKPVMEAGVARTVLESAGRQFQQLRSRHREDPPDCEAIIEGLRYGIEVSELVDEPTLKATIKGGKRSGFYCGGAISFALNCRNASIRRTRNSERSI
jgi:hypothetical protein